jgi:hypothetical protein
VAVTRHKGLALYVLHDQAPLLGSALTVPDLIGEAYHDDPDIIVVPVTRLAPGFLELRTGLAGEVFQKMEQYGRRLAILDDVTGAVAASTALRDFVVETNGRGHHLFATSMDELLARL